MPVVELTLVNLASAVGDGRAAEQDFSNTARRALSCCASAQSILKRQEKKPSHFQKRKATMSGDDTLPAKLMNDMMKYVKLNDRYTALCSLLLKSRVFHQTHLQIENETVPLVVDLPRTKQGKPFIPKIPFATEETEPNLYPFSISHQFPFCGVARLDNVNSNNLHLGLDIVMFEPLRTDLYKDAADFLLVFRDSFTEWEWERIHAYPDGDNMLTEFYLRWSMKESYSKALGLGLHLEFSAFETQLNIADDEFDCDSGSYLSLWSRVSKHKEGIHYHGRVIQQTEETYWDFLFLPLFCENEATGCACVCFGPIDKKNIDSSFFNEEISWTTLDDLIQFHTREE